MTDPPEPLTGAATPVSTYTFVRGDFAGPRIYRIHTDGGTVDLTVGFTDDLERHVIDVRVTPHDGLVTDGEDVGGTWQLAHTDDGVRLTCQSRPTST